MKFLINQIRKLVLEDEEKPSISLRNAFVCRIIIWGIIILAGACVLYAGLHHEGYIRSKYFFQVIKALIVTFVHLGYLYLVFWLLILRKPPEKLYWQQLLFPFILGMAYFFYAISIYFQWETYMYGEYGKYFKLASYSLFVCLYLLWLFRDFFEFSENPERRKVIFLWIIVESFSIFILMGAILIDLKCFSSEASIFSKDWAISISLSLWVIITIRDFLGREGKYDSIYRDYMSGNKIEVMPKICMPISIKSRINCILDFGCAGGDRVLEIIKWINFEKEQLKSMKVMGYDKNREWEGFFNEKLREYNGKFKSNKNHLVPKEYHLVVLSHVLYDLNTVNELVSILKECKEGTCVIIRGASPNSFFIPVSISNSVKILRASQAHLWYSFWLNLVIKEANLVRLNSAFTDEPDIVVSQVYSLNEVSIKSASKLIDHLYDGTLSQRFKEYLSALKDYGKVNTIPNEDLIYIFKKGNGDV